MIQGVISLHEDNPGGQWLRECREDAREIKNRTGIGVISKITAYVVAEVRPADILKFPGARGEEEYRGRGEKLARLRKRVAESGGLDLEAHPPMIWVDLDGDVFIAEGNHRLYLAYEQNLPLVPVLIRYFAGAENMYGPLQLTSKVRTMFNNTKEQEDGIDV